jgi:hypothetical protein
VPEKTRATQRQQDQIKKDGERRRKRDGETDSHVHREDRGEGEKGRRIGNRGLRERCWSDGNVIGLQDDGNGQRAEMDRQAEARSDRARSE